MLRNNQTDYAADLQWAFERWDECYRDGCMDPLYTDGENLNQCRKYILYYRSQLGDNPPPSGFPEAYYREVPPEVDPGYMACPDEIRAAAPVSLKAYYDDPDYQFILVHQSDIPPEIQDKFFIDTALGYVSGLEQAIAEDDLLTMQCHKHPDICLGSFETCSRRMRNFFSDGLVPVVIRIPSEPKDEDFDDDYDEDCSEDFDEDEQGFGGMTMKM